MQIVKRRKLSAKTIDLLDSLEANRAKKELRVPFLPYIKKRYGTTKIR